MSIGLTQEEYEQELQWAYEDGYVHALEDALSNIQRKLADYKIMDKKRVRT